MVRWLWRNRGRLSDHRRAALERVGHVLERQRRQCHYRSALRRTEWSPGRLLGRPRRLAPSNLQICRTPGQVSRMLSYPGSMLEWVVARIAFDYGSCSGEVDLIMTETRESIHCAANAVCDVLRYFGDVSYAVLPPDVAHQLGGLKKSFWSSVQSLIDREID